MATINSLVSPPIGGFQKWSIAIEASQREFKSTLDRSLMLTVLVVALVVLATFPVAVKVGQSISGPIQSCVVRLEQLADPVCVSVFSCGRGVRHDGQPAAAFEQRQGHG